MTNVLLVHGSFGNPYENWLPWLNEKLAEKKIQCFVPHFPTPEYQNYPNWCLLLEGYRKIGIISNETIFVGHSLGALFIAKYILDKAVYAKGYIAVAGFNNYRGKSDDFYNVNKLFFMQDNDLSKLKLYIPIRHCFMSDNDSHLPIEQMEQFSSLIGGESHLVPNGGHFNSSSGFNTFHQLLDLVLKIVAL